MNNRIFKLFHKNSLNLILVFFIFLPFLFLLVQGRVIFWGTASLQFVPWTQFLYDSILDGYFPLWNPYNGLGSPFLANHQSAVFYPLNWLMFPFYLIGNIKGLVIGITLLIPIHLSIAAFGIMQILRKLGKSYYAQMLGGLVFVFSGYILTRLSFISMVWAFAWLPWIVLACLNIKKINENGFGRTIIYLSLFLALQLLAGHAQTSFYTIMVGLYFILFHDYKNLSTQLLKFVSFFISLVIAVFISAVQVIPTIEFLNYSQRSSEVGYDLAISSSLWPGRLLTTFFADFWGNPNYNRFLSGGSFWEENLYLGVFPILFSSIVLWFLLRRNRARIIPPSERILIFALFGLVIFVIFFSFGRFFFVFPLLYKYVPGFDLFQAPSRFLIVYAFLTSIFTAYGFDLWINSKFNYKKTNIYFLIFGSLLFFTVLIKFFYNEIPEITINSLVIGCSLGILFGLLTLLKDRSNINIAWIQITVFLLLTADMVFHNFGWNNFQSIKIYEEINDSQNNDLFRRTLLLPEAEKFLKFSLFFRPDRLQAITELSSIHPEFIPNTNLLNNRYQLINNFDPLQLNDFTEFWQYISGLNKQDLELLLPLLGGERIINLEPNQSNFLTQYNLKAKEIVQWYSCLTEEDRDLHYDQILQVEKSNPEHRCLIAEGTLFSDQSQTDSRQQDVQLKITEFSPNRIFIEYSADQAGWMVIRQNWFPGWTAILNDDEILGIHKVDYLFQGIQVPAGMHTLEIRYYPNSFKFGLVISIICFITLILFFCYPNYRKNDKLKLLSIYD